MSKVKSLVCRFNAEKVHQAKTWADNPHNGLKAGEVYQEEVTLSSKYDDALTDENQVQDEIQTFQEATPWGELQFAINNPNAIGFIKDGIDYYVKIEMVPQELQHNPAAWDFHFGDKSED